MTHHIAVQTSTTSYEVWVFESPEHARAYIAVRHLSGARPLSNAYGRKAREVDHTGYLGEQIEALALSAQLGELDQPARRVDLHPAAIPQQRRTYTSGPVVKVVATGQRIGLLTPGGIINAVIAHLGNNFITVNLDNGRGARNIERRIDATTTGPGLTLSAIVSPQAVTA